MMSLIDPNVTIRQSKSVLSTDLDEEVVMMHVESGRYLLLQNEAVDIWRLLAEPTDRNAIVEALVSEYEVERDVCEQEVGDLLNQLVELDMIATAAD